MCQSAFVRFIELHQWVVICVILWNAYFRVSVKKMKLYLLWFISTFLAEVQALLQYRLHARLLQLVSDLLVTITLTFQSFGKILRQQSEVTAVCKLLILLFHMYIVYNLVHLNAWLKRYWYLYIVYIGFVKCKSKNYVCYNISNLDN